MATATSTKRTIGDILVEQGVITPLELDEALHRKRHTADFLQGVTLQEDKVGALAGLDRAEVVPEPEELGDGAGAGDEHLVRA